MTGWLGVRAPGVASVQTVLSSGRPGRLAPTQPALLEMERAVARRDYPTALNHALMIFNAMDRTMGLLEGVEERIACAAVVAAQG